MSEGSDVLASPIVPGSRWWDDLFEDHFEVKWLYVSVDGETQIRIEYDESGKTYLVTPADFVERNGGITPVEPPASTPVQYGP